MDNDVVELGDLQEGPLRHATLPSGLIERIKTFKDILGDAEPTPLEKTIENFKYDADPEREILVWEKIAKGFQKYLEENPTDDAGVRNDVFAILLGTSIGIDDWSVIKNIPIEEIETVVSYYPT